MKMNAKSFHDEDGWSRVLERRPPVRKTSMQWAKNNEITTIKKSCHSGTTFFKKKYKNNTGFSGAETAKKGCSLA
mgnify:CR=1 FL=1